MEMCCLFFFFSSSYEVVKYSKRYNTCSLPNVKYRQVTSTGLASITMFLLTLGYSNSADMVVVKDY